MCPVRTVNCDWIAGDCPDFSDYGSAPQLKHVFQLNDLSLGVVCVSLDALHRQLATK